MRAIGKTLFEIFFCKILQEHSIFYGKTDVMKRTVEVSIDVVQLNSKKVPNL